MCVVFIVGIGNTGRLQATCGLAIDGISRGYLNGSSVRLVRTGILGASQHPASVLPDWILYWFDAVWFDDEGEGVFLHPQS